jgi:formate hydrogenlyase subunit 5
VIAVEDRAVEPGGLATELRQLGGRLMMLFANAPAPERRELWALVRSAGRLNMLRAPVRGHAYPAVTPMTPAAHWFEREIHDLHGLTPDGHPRLEPLVRHVPDEGEVQLPQEQDVRLAHRGAERLAGPGVFVIPYGPVRSGVFESAQFLVQTGGEDVAYCAQRLFFKRRGAERRICEVPLELAVLVAERVSGTSSVAHALAFSHAVESLAETEVPPRAEAIRRILAELERLYNHLEVTVRECEDASLAVGQAQFAALKERLHRLAGAVVGNRYLRGAVVPGGTRIDLDAAALDLIRTAMSEWERDWERTLAVLLRTDSFLDRLVSAGPLSEEDARDFGCVGPVARASGIEIDTRRDLPYDGYPAFDVARHVDGDAMARMEVRFQEAAASLGLIREAVASLAPGATRAELRPFTRQSALGAAESARGETLYWLEADGDSALRFCKLRAASFMNFGVFNRVFDSQVLTDFSFIEHSLGLSPAGCDA